MSFILDALRKSENERQQQAPAEFSTVPSSPDEPGTPRWLWVLAALLAINVIVLGGFVLRPGPIATPLSPQPAANPSSTVSEPVAAREPVVDNAVDDSGERPQRQSFDQRLEEARLSLSERQLSNALADDGTRQQPDSSDGVATTNVASSGTTSTRAGPNFASLPSLTELRVNGELQLPDLHVDIHVFSNNPSDRFVFINMNKYREADQLSEGPVVREITRDGVILDYRGSLFSLLRE